MAELLVMRTTNNDIVNSISLQYDEDTIEAQKIIWRSSDFVQYCRPVSILSQEYNLVREEMDLVDSNTFEFTLPTGIFLSYDEAGDLDLSDVQEYLRSR